MTGLEEAIIAGFIVESVSSTFTFLFSKTEAEVEKIC